MAYTGVLLVLSCWLRSEAYRLDKFDDEDIMPSPSFEEQASLVDGKPKEGIMVCNTSLWRGADKKCDDCTALVKTDGHHQSCRKFCEDQGMNCRGTFKVEDGKCQKGPRFSCSWWGDLSKKYDKAFKKSKEGRVLCQCKHYEEDTCDKRKWVDVKRNCKGCMALVNHINTRYGTCAKYCKLRGLRCVNAFEDQDDDCQAHSKIRCEKEGILSARTGKPTSDLICQCEAPPRCNISNWENVKTQCGDCSALIKNFRKYESCDNYCKQHKLKCRSAWEEGDYHCQKESKWTCSDKRIKNTKGELTNDVLCRCG